MGYWNPYHAWKMIEKHLYNSENWSDSQRKAFQFMYGFNIMGFTPWKGIADYLYDKRKTEEWTRNNPDIPWHDPRNVPGMGTNAAGFLNGYSRGLNFVSKNAASLYEDKPIKKPKHMSYEMAMDLYFMGLR